MTEPEMDSKEYWRGQFEREVAYSKQMTVRMTEAEAQNQTMREAIQGMLKFRRSRLVTTMRPVQHAFNELSDSLRLT